MEKKHAYLVIIPAYNEEKTIQEVVSRARRYADICVINDNSKDNTAEILDSIDGIHVIHHQHNTHIPGGLLDGMRYAVSQNYDYAIAMDAGLSHNPDEIPFFINHPHSDLAIGSRSRKTNTPFFRRVLSASGNLVYNSCLDFPRSLFKPCYYKDITSGFRRYSSEAMKLLLSKSIESHSFDILFESAMFIYKNDLTLSEVDITYDFSNSSLSPNVVRDCLKMCFKAAINPRK